MIIQSQQPAIGSMAQNDNFLNALNAKQEKSSIWIVDSRASGNMTGNTSLLENYKPCYENFTMKITYRSLSKIACPSSITISSTLFLNSILFVPNS